MLKKSKISKAEWRVMEVLWKKSPRTSAEVIDALAEDLTWHPKTVRTLLSRLVDKGCAITAKEKNRNLYSAAITHEESVRHESQSFLSRVFSGNTEALLTHFVSRGNLTEAQIEKLKSLLEDRERSP